MTFAFACAVCKLVLLVLRVHILHEVCIRQCLVQFLVISRTDRPVCVSDGVIFAQVRTASWPSLANLRREILLQGLVRAAFFELLSSLLSLHRACPSCSSGIRRLDSFCTSSHMSNRSFPFGHCTPDTALSISICLLAYDIKCC